MAGKRKERKSEQTEKRRRTGSQIIEIEEAQKRRQEKRAELKKKEKAQRRRAIAQEKASRPKMSGGKKFLVCGIVLIAVLGFVFNGYRIVNLNLDKAVYEKKYEERLAEKTRLENELGLVDDPEYVEQQARDRFHMLRDGETLFIFSEKKSVEAQ